MPGTALLTSSPQQRPRRGNSLLNKREELWRSGGRQSLWVESLSPVSHCCPFPIPVLIPVAALQAWPCPGWPRSCLFPALQGFRMLCLHAAGCCGRLSKGNCLMWKGKRWLSRKQSLPLCWGPGLTQRGRDMFEFLTSPCVRNTLGMPGCSLRPAVRQ